MLSLKALTQDVFNVRKFFLLLAQVIFLIGLMVAGFTSCSTSDGEDGFEGEINAELDDMDGASLDDATVAEDDSSSGADDAESGMTADNDDEFSDENFDESGKAKPSDTEFAAEDTEKPADTNTSSTDDLAEQDLQNELGKGGKETETASSSVQPKPNDQIIPYPEEPTGANIPPGLKADPSEAPVAATDATPVSAPSSAGVATGTITSKEASMSNDPFEQITAAPTVPQEDIGQSDPLVTEVDPPLPSLKAAKEIVPVSKVERDPFFRNERLMNTVYIARPGDDLGTISQKIFNEDKRAILLEDNPHVTKGVEPGDKIYYNSPNRVEDKKTILSYYEDNNMSPMYYITKKGDDIQKIGRQVLGFEEAWKEVWAVNDSLQTQALLPSGLKLRYWTGNEMKMQVAAPAPAATEPPPQMAAKEEPPEIPMDIPSDPAPIPTDDPGLRLSEPSPLPSESLPSAPMVENADKESNLMTMAGGAIAALAILALIAIQIKNRRKDSMGMPPSLDFNKV